ncbi:MAG: hypothetical protein Q4C77_11550 [Eubacteriales bacterium]|nr:hypothetical protein [Eubacteriales bacterium]
MKNKIVFTACAVITVLALQGCAAAQKKTDMQQKYEDAANLNADESTVSDNSRIRIGVTLYSIQNEYTKRFANAAQSQAKQMGIELQLYDAGNPNVWISCDIQT